MYGDPEENDAVTVDPLVGTAVIVLDVVPEGFVNDMVMEL